MGIQDIIDGKREWRAHMARVKALPRDYQIVYDEIQKYLFKVGPAELSEWTGQGAGREAGQGTGHGAGHGAGHRAGHGVDHRAGLLSDIVDFFEEGAAVGKAVLDVTGQDVAAFCDELLAARGSKTIADANQEYVDQTVSRAMKKWLDKQR